MNIDFHYGVINVIAQRAGFSPEDAQVISYASQYTDDCTFYEDLPVEYPTPGSDASTIYDDWNVHMENFFPMWKQKAFRGYNFREKSTDATFDPICTAYKNIKKRLISMVKSWSFNQLRKELKRLSNDGAQKKVWTSFHFVPRLKSGTDSSFSGHWVQHNSILLRSYIEILVEQVKDPSTDASTRLLALVAMGIAIHSYADTWSHEGFSGRWNSDENDISNLKVKREYTASDSSSMPDFGHLEAGSWVDNCHSDLQFEFCNSISGRESNVQRWNCTHFLEASSEIFTALSGESIDLDTLNFLRNAMRLPLDPGDRIDFMRSELETSTAFNGITLPHYQEQEWENEIFELKPNSFEEQAVFGPHKKWFLFQVAALAHRRLIHAYLEE